MLRYYTPKFLFRRYEIIRRIKSGHCFLEIGPGSLNLTEDLLTHFNTGTLIEYNPSAAKILNSMHENIKQRLNLIIGDFMTINLGSTHDCIIACEVMEHIDDDNQFINNIHNLLRDKGQIILSVPAHKHLWGKDDDSVGHVRRYEKIELIELLAQNNFKNISIISYGYPFVYLLRYLRILFTDRLYRRNNVLSKEVRSQYSGISPMFGVFWFIRFLLNKYTIYPLCFISSFFNDHDLSDSYIITAEK